MASPTVGKDGHNEAELRQRHRDAIRIVAIEMQAIVCFSTVVRIIDR